MQHNNGVLSELRPGNILCIQICCNGIHRNAIDVFLIHAVDVIIISLYIDSCLAVGKSGELRCLFFEYIDLVLIEVKIFCT